MVLRNLEDAKSRTQASTLWAGALVVLEVPLASGLAHSWQRKQTALHPPIIQSVQ